ncbi:MAG: HAD family hydrolase [Erysipelotrichaceae bacterium]|nr:HAD family hydrolase [Erysipelotrichaceae bacterium]
MSEIKVIMFDLDNTLLDRTEGAYRTFRHFLSSVLNIDPDTVYGESILQDMINWDGYGNIRKTFIMEGLEKYYGIDLGEFDINRWWYNNLWRFEDLFPETLEVLNYLKQKYRLAIVTNGDNYSQNSKIDRNGLRDYFDFIVISADVGSEKPDPLMYQMALDHFGIQPEEAVYVGDTFGKDILGAHNIGIRPIWIWPDDSRRGVKGITRIYKISDLLDIL